MNERNNVLTQQYRPLQLFSTAHLPGWPNTPQWNRWFVDCTM